MATFELPKQQKTLKKLDDKMMDAIMELTGASSIFIMTSDHNVPCPDALAGEPCGEHRMYVAMTGINPLQVPQIIADQTGVTDFKIKPADRPDPC